MIYKPDGFYEGSIRSLAKFIFNMPWHLTKLNYLNFTPNWFNRKFVGRKKWFHLMSCRVTKLVGCCGVKTLDTNCEQNRKCHVLQKKSFKSLKRAKIPPPPTPASKPLSCELTFGLSDGVPISVSRHTWHFRKRAFGKQCGMKLLCNWWFRNDKTNDDVRCCKWVFRN